LVLVEYTAEGLADMETGIAGVCATTINTILLVAGFPVVQVRFEVRMHCTASLFNSEASVYEDELEPTFSPFFIHSKEGELPPFTGFAVKVTMVPEQMVGPLLAVMDTLTAKFGFTTMVIVLEEAGLPVVHPAFDVITHCT
jgi:hypothetical protein